MAVDEYLPAIFIILGVWLLIRWFTKTPTPVNTDSIPGITTSTVETIHAAFPDIPLPNLIYSLSKTRSGQATSEEIIEKGYLPTPPATFQIPSSLQPPTVNPPSAPSSPVVPSSGLGSANRSYPGGKGVSLIEKYGLSNRVPSRKGKEVDPGEKGGDVVGQDTPGVGDGKGKWEDSREGREKGLKERKEKMILEARRKMMEKEAARANAESTASS